MKKRNTIFTSKNRPFFDKSGNWQVPRNLIWPNKNNHKLSLKEWGMLLLLETRGAPSYLFSNLIGSRTTQWRLRKSLTKKGYL